MKRLRLLAPSPSLAPVASGAAFACSAGRTTADQFTTGSGGAGGDDPSGTSTTGNVGTGSVSGATTSGDDFFDAGQGGSAASGGQGCAEETQFIYTLAAD